MARVDSFTTPRAIAALGHKTGDDRLYLRKVYLHLLMGSSILKGPTTARASLQGHRHSLVDGLSRWPLSVAEPTLAWAAARWLRLSLGLISREGGCLAVAPAQLGFQGSDASLGFLQLAPEGLYLSLEPSAVSTLTWRHSASIITHRRTLNKYEYFFNRNYSALS
jgi:hypothetical protein